MPGLLPFGDPILPASIRYNNPGAQWPGPSALAYGATGHGTIGGGNKIAMFPDPVSGAAALFDLLRRGYAGMPLRAAIGKWSGGNSVPDYMAGVTKATGLAPDAILTPDLLDDPDIALPLAKAMARHEAGRDYPLSDEQWRRAHGTVFSLHEPAGLPVQARDIPQATSPDGDAQMSRNAQLTVGQRTMAGGVLPPNMGQGSNGLLPFGDAPAVSNPIDANRNAILGYLAGALQGGNLGQSIGRGLKGWLGGSQTDATEQTRRAAAQYVAQQPDIDPAVRSALMHSPALAMHYLQAKARPHVTRDIAEYEYARKQGFTGTLTDFIQSKRAGALSAQE